MKLEKNSLNADSFWKWFSKISNSLAANVENEELLNELDERVRQLSPGLSWEIGPGRKKDWCLAISPNLNSELLPETDAVVAQAPELPDWEVTSTRPKKDWKGWFEIRREDGSCFSVDSSGWLYVLLRYPDGFYEVLLQHEVASQLSPDERWTAAAIVLEGLLGERTLIDKVQAFDLVSELGPQLSREAKPIQKLGASFGPAL